MGHHSKHHHSSRGRSSHSNRRSHHTEGSSSDHYTHKKNGAGLIATGLIAGAVLGGRRSSHTNQHSTGHSNYSHHTEENYSSSDDYCTHKKEVATGLIGPAVLGLSLVLSVMFIK